MDMKVSSTIGFERANQELLQRHRRGRVRRDDHRHARAAAAELREHRRAQPRAAGLRQRRSAPARARARSSSRQRGRRAASSTCAPSCSSTRRTSPARSASPRCAPASAPSSPGSPTASSDVVFVGRDDEDGHRAAELAAAVGIAQHRRLPAGGMTAWREEKRDVERTERLDRPRAARPLAGRPRRDPDPRRPRAGRVGRRPHPRLGPHALPRHPARSPTASTPRSPIAVICGSGQRAAVGASLHRSATARRKVIHVVEGGVPLWKREGWPTEQPEPQG